MIKNIIFDYNGTLVDDHIISHNLANNILKKLGLKEISYDTYKKETDHPYMKFWEKFTDTPKETLEELYKEELESSEHQVYLVEGTKELLKFCNEKKISLIILSAYEPKKLIQELKQENIYHYFMDIFGGVHDKKNAIQELINKHKINPKETIFIGDSAYDISVGNHAGVISVGASYGYEPVERLKKENPKFIIQSIIELKKIIK